jgi:oligopeptidase B
MHRSVDISKIPVPLAKRIDKALEQHGHLRNDPYSWLENRKNSKVIDYLKAENRYTEAIMKNTRSLQESLFKEIKTRTKQDDSTVPYRKANYFYYARFEKAKDYPIYARKRESLSAAEEILLDVNKLARGHGFYRVGAMRITPDETLLAFAVDTKGNRIFEVFFKDLKTNKILKESIKNTGGNLQWAQDSKHLFYNRIEPTTLRSHQIWRHAFGSSSKKDQLVYEEKDETFDAYVQKTKSEKYLTILSNQSITSEVRILEADNPLGDFKIFERRKRGVEYNIDHHHDRFYIHTNWGAQNFRLMNCPENKTTKSHWKDFIAPRDSVLLDSFELFKDYVVVLQRNQGQKEFFVRAASGLKSHTIDFPDAAYNIDWESNEEPGSNVFRFSYSSLATPETEFDYDLVKRQKKLLKEEEIFGGFKKENYQVERLRIRARDGAQVPVSLVFRKDLFKKHQNPLFVYGYGSYGISIDPRFNADLVSLLDRGFVFAIAHIRGGQELGRPWYDDGKLLKKKNTFFDFIDATEGLVRAGYGDRQKLFAQGGSAGGLLMGAVMNLRPDLFKGVIANVAFVDVVTTMLDESIPLTTSEFDEWGNPKNKKYYQYMLSYSPYDNVQATAYPHLLVTTGIHDSQVQYFEPAKWVAKLRHTKTDDSLLLLKTHLKAGHGGASARDESYREQAFEYAFFLKVLGLPPR